MKGKNMIRVSAIVSAYFGEKYLQGRLDNLLREKVDEIIVICQVGSPEEKISNKYYLEQKIRTLITTDDIPTVYDAWNRGIKEASGEFVTNANCDDRFTKGGLALLVKALDDHPDYAVAYGNQEIVEKVDGNVVGFFNWNEGGFRELLDGDFLGPMPLWRKSLHEKYGYFDAGMISAGDYEFWLRLAFNNEKFFKVNKTVGRYLRADNSLERRDPSLAMFETAQARTRYFHQAGAGVNGELYIGMCTTRQLDVEHVLSLITTREFTWFPVKNQPADFARNMIVNTFLNNPAKPDFLLLTDSDATWAGKKAVDRLMERNLPMVCGTFFKRDIPPVPTIGPSASTNASGDSMYNFGKTIEAVLARISKSGLKDDEVNNNLVLPKDESDLFKIDGCGMHFVMIRRDVLEAIDPPWFQYTVPGAGEDFAFCRKVRAAGFDIYADLSVYSGHIVGDGLNFGLRQFLMFYNNTKEINSKEQIWKA
jgi:glycosyltransferase involved in cell wall biosynthesis